MGEKRVGFYQPILLDTDDQRHEIKGGDFWSDVHRDIAALSYAERRFNLNAAPFYGVADVGTKPAQKYIRLGRVRTASDWPDTIDDRDQSTAPLTLPTGRNLFESAYMVPFGTTNVVAIMGPMHGIVSIRAVERWLNVALDLVTKGYTLELLPVVDTAVADKLVASEGVTRLQVRVPAGSSLELPDGAKTGAELALENAVAAAVEELSAEIVLSAGRGRATAKSRLDLKKSVLRLLRAGGIDKLEVTMTSEDEATGRLVSQQHDLLRDIITTTATFPTDDHTQLDVDDVLIGINEAIRQYRERR